jgi:hypothetical protein
MRKPRASGFEGPLAPYADAFAEQLDEAGYAPWTVQDKLHVVDKLSQWLNEHQLPVEVLDERRVCAFLLEFQGRSVAPVMVTRRRCMGCSRSCPMTASFLPQALRQTQARKPRLARNSVAI